MLGDFSPVNKHALRAVARFMAEREVAFAWKKGVACLFYQRPPGSGCSFRWKPRTFSSLTTAVHFGSRFLPQACSSRAWSLHEVLHSRQSFEPPRRVLAALRGKPLLGPALRAGASLAAWSQGASLIFSVCQVSLALGPWARSTFATWCRDCMQKAKSI